MKKIKLKTFCSFLSDKFERLEVYKIKKNNDYEYLIHFSYLGDLRPNLLEAIEDEVLNSLDIFINSVNVMLDSEASDEDNVKTFGLIEVSFIKNKNVVVLMEKSENIFNKNFKNFINKLWRNDVEKKLINQIFKYKNPILNDPAKGKEFLMNIYEQNQELIESDCSLEFKDALNKLINEYKTDDQLNELEDQTKYFNNKTKKNYSDASYFSEVSKNKKMPKKIKKLDLIKKIDEFFYIAENEKALASWEDYKKEILTESNIKTWEKYVKHSTLKEEVNIAKTLMKLHNLIPRAEKYLQEFELIGENYLYRPTKEYCYKVSLNTNPYADKEGHIYFDNEDTARLYADHSKGKYDYIGKNSIKESEEKPKSKVIEFDVPHITPYEDWNGLGNVENDSDDKLLTESINQPDYKFYVVSLEQRKIISGFEYVEDAKEYIGEMDDSLGKLVPYTKKTLLIKGLNPDDDNSWGTDHDSQNLMEDMTTGDMAVPDKPINLNEATFELADQPETSELVNSDSFESRLLDFDPYKNASNKIDGSKTKIKKFDCLFERYIIKDHNLNEKKTDKFFVLIENSYKKKNIVKFPKKEFAHFIFKNCDVRNYMKEDKFDYYGYMKSKTYGFTKELIKEYFDSKAKDYSLKINEKKNLKESRTIKDYNQWKSILTSIQIKTKKPKNEIGYWNKELNEGIIHN